MTHPYKSQPPRARWSLAVGRSATLHDIYTKKFDITPRDRIMAAGSCFAQHIGRRLAQSGFGYLDFEPAPPVLPLEDRSKFGYAMFSGRYGNIYTARQMVQLIKRARGRFTPVDDVWEQDGRFYDPYRPNIEPDGFASLEEFATMREQHYDAVRRLVSKSTMLVFTLGLTEAWINREDGAVYPVCPGTIAGKFDAEKHRFENFSYAQVRDDVEKMIAMFRRRKPGYKFLFTVSPVPLAATATEHHVLPATVYSKSVLRAVAGDVAANDPLIDYFPSFEIVNNPQNRSSFFEDNLRDVRSASVDKVMSYFFAEHPVVGAGTAAVSDKVAPAATPAAAVSGATVVDSFGAKHDEDVVCEEAVYDRD